MVKYQNLTTASKFLIKRFSHKKRFLIVYKILQKLNFKTILDFGSGDGYFCLKYLLADNNIEKITLYEPDPVQLQNLSHNIIKAKKVNLIHNLKNEKFECIICLEVLEHFEANDLENRLIEIKSLMKNVSTLIISVPIEIGFSGVIKNLIRILIGQTHPNTSFKNLFNIFFGIPIYRNKNKLGYIDSHIGFNYKILENKLKDFDFKISSVHYSPFEGLIGKIFASQIIYVMSVGTQKI